MDNQEPVVQEPSNHLNNITIFSMAIFVLLSLSAVAFLYYQNQQLKKMLASYQTPAPLVSPKPSAEAETANWKTYTNAKYVYSFKYPSNLNIEINQVDSANYVQIIFNKSSNNSFNIKASVKYPINQPKFLLDTESTKTKNINGKLWSVFELPNDSLGIQLEENSVLYSAIYSVSEKTLVEQILSTFKFLEATPSASPTSY